MPGENLEVDVGSGGEEIITPPREIGKTITAEDLEQKTWLTQENKEGIYEILSYQKYLETYTGLRDRVLDNLVECACTFGKSLDGQGLAAMVGLAGAIHQQPSTNVNIGGGDLMSKMGGKN